METASDAGIFSRFLRTFRNSRGQHRTWGPEFKAGHLEDGLNAADKDVCDKKSRKMCSPSAGSTW